MAVILAVAGDDDAFSNLLRDGLESLEAHRVIVTRSDTEAIKIIGGQDVDMAIVDVDLGHTEPIALVNQMRRIDPSIRVMWMPFLGYELSDEMQSVDVQGILTKPFFMETLSDQIEEALSVPLSSETATVPDTTPAGHDVAASHGLPVSEAGSGGADRPAHTPTREAVKRSFPSDDLAKGVVNRLALELDAEVVVVVDRAGRLLARAGHMNKRNATELASILTNQVTAASSVASFMKEKGGSFTNSIHEGEHFRLFSVILSGTGFALSVITRVEVPLGTVRYHIRRAATNLSTLLQDRDQLSAE